MELARSKRLAGPGIDSLSCAVALLLEATELASDLAVDPWDFAVELDILREAGLTNSTLRWMVAKGYLRHAREDAGATSGRRAFQPCCSLAFPPSTCFVLTESGLQVARTQFVAGDLASPSADIPSAPPCWDPDRQELRVGKMIVKRFRVPAPNQEVILATFQEEGWPIRIDDPLSPSPGLDAKRRLHETITSLNRNQKHRLIRFHGDGSGEGVRWELAGKG